MGPEALPPVGALQALLTSSRVEMGNMVLDTGAKGVLVTKWQRTWPKLVLMFCGE